MPNGRCSKHGGKTPGGMASPNYKHGKFSKYAPAPIAELAYDAITDPTLYDLTELVALYQARIQSALRAMKQGGAGTETIQEIRKAYTDLNLARRQKNGPAVFAAEDRMEKLLSDAEHDIWLWKEVDVAAQNMKKLMESERKRRIEAHTLIPVIKAHNIVLQIVLAVRSHITDQTILSNIQAKVTEIVGAYPEFYEHEE